MAHLVRCAGDVRDRSVPDKDFQVLRVIMKYLYVPNFIPVVSVLYAVQCEPCNKVSDLGSRSELELQERGRGLRNPRFPDSAKPGKVHACRLCHAGVRLLPRRICPVGPRARPLRQLLTRQDRERSRTVYSYALSAVTAMWVLLA